MQAKEIVRVLTGACAVYLVMAACSATGKDQSTSDAGVGDALVGSVPSANAETSGSRLKTTTYAGDDGSSQFTGWYDAMLKLQCNFAKAADGQIRCLPRAAAVAFYSDSGCLWPVAVSAKGCAVPAHISEMIVSSSCTGSGSRTLSMGAKYNGSSAFVKGADGACSDSPGMFTFYAGLDMYSAGAEVPPSLFVSAVEKISP